MRVEGRTRRLLLKPLELADADRIQELFPHWEIVRFLVNHVPWPYPPDGALKFLRDSALLDAESDRAWHWSIRLDTEPSQMIGSISLMKGDSDNRGFWLGLPWRGRGYMSEACVWANDFWFDTLGFSVLRVPKAAANVASRRISEKQGMRVVSSGEKDYVSGRLPYEVWQITADEWHAWKARAPQTI